MATNLQKSSVQSQRKDTMMFPPSSPHRLSPVPGSPAEVMSGTTSPYLSPFGVSQASTRREPLCVPVGGTPVDPPSARDLKKLSVISTSKIPPPSRFDFPRYPVQIKCYSCGYYGPTTVNKIIERDQFRLCCCMGFLGLCWACPIWLLPFMCGSCKNVQHRCSHCRAILGTKRVF